MSPATNPFRRNMILLPCSDLIHIREKYFNVNSLKVLFKEVSSDIILNFLKEINTLIKKIYIYIYNYYIYTYIYIYIVFDFEMFHCITVGFNVAF